MIWNSLFLVSDRQVYSSYVHQYGKLKLKIQNDIAGMTAWSLENSSAEFVMDLTYSVVKEYCSNFVFLQGKFNQIDNILSTQK